MNNMRVIESIVLSQEKALKELKAASKQLYKKAVEVCITRILENNCPLLVHATNK